MARLQTDWRGSRSIRRRSAAGRRAVRAMRNLEFSEAMMRSRPEQSRSRADRNTVDGGDDRLSKSKRESKPGESAVSVPAAPAACISIVACAERPCPPAPVTIATHCSGSSETFLCLDVIDLSHGLKVEVEPWLRSPPNFLAQ